MFSRAELGCTANPLPISIDLGKNHVLILCMVCLSAVSSPPIVTLAIRVCRRCFGLGIATHVRLWLRSRHTLWHLKSWTRHYIECTFLTLHDTSTVFISVSASRTVMIQQLSLLGHITGWCHDFRALYCSRDLSKIRWRRLFHFNERLSHWTRVNWAVLVYRGPCAIWDYPSVYLILWVGCLLIWILCNPNLGISRHFLQLADHLAWLFDVSSSISLKQNSGFGLDRWAFSHGDDRTVTASPCHRFTTIFETAIVGTLSSTYSVQVSYLRLSVGDFTPILFCQ